MMKFGSLFAGIGGIDLGLERASMRCAWQVENDEYATRVLAKHWPDVPRFGDVRECGGHNLSPVDLICGGFPCQDISNAGKREGIGGSRSGLWSEFARIISELRPRYVLVENVAALLGRGMGTVLGDLSALGYDAEWEVISACAFGATHTRERLFIVAYPNSIDGSPRVGPFTYGAIAHERRNHSPSTGSSQGIRLAPPSQLPRGAYGLPYRLERTIRLGNAVVPQIAEFIGRLIVAHALPSTRPAREAEQARKQIEAGTFAGQEYMEECLAALVRRGTQ